MLNNFVNCVKMIERKCNVHMSLSVVLLGVLCPQLAISAEILPYLESSGSTRLYFGQYGLFSTSLRTNFRFLGTNYSVAYFNGRGLITFGGGTLLRYTSCAPVIASYPTISVFGTDTHNDRGDGNTTAKLLYRHDSSRSSLDRVSKDVFTAFPTLRDTVTLKWMLIVTWYNIPSWYSNATHYHNNRNTFQGIITTDGTHSFALFYLNRISYPVSGRDQSAAVSGIFSNNRSLTYSIPGSCNFSLANSITRMSNFNVPGKFGFKVDSAIEHPVVDQCNPIMNATKVQPIQFKPSVISVEGSGVPLLVLGLNLCVSYKVTNSTCIHHDKSRKTPMEIPGSIIPHQYTFNEAIACPTPNFDTLGRVKVDVVVHFSNKETFKTFGYIYVVKENVEPVLSLQTANLSGNVFLNVSWKVSSLKSKAIAQYFQTKLNFAYPTSSMVHLTMQELRGSQWREFAWMKSIRSTNNGTFMYQLSEDAKTALLEDKVDPMRVLKIHHVVTMSNGHQLKTMQLTDIEHTTYLLAKLKLESSDKIIFDEKCLQWHAHVLTPPSDTLPCPHTLQQALADWRFHPQNEKKHLNITTFLQCNPSASGAISQCTYDTTGNLTMGYPHGSRLLQNSPTTRKNFWKYYGEDFISYLYCCELSSNKEENCKNYYFAKRQLLYDEQDYVPPHPFAVIGATHVYTFDGASYMLNGVGTFWLLKFTKQIEMQILLEKREDPEANNIVTVKAVVIQSFSENETSAKFQVTANASNGLLIWLDDEPVNFYENTILNTEDFSSENFTLYHDHATVFINGTSEALFSFSCGLSVKFLLSAKNESLNLLGSASNNFLGNVSGLLGNFDGNSQNDLAIRNGTIIPINSTVDIIFKEYAEQWRVLQTESLFLFPSGKNYTTFNSPHPTFSSHQFSVEHLLKTIPTYMKFFCGHIIGCQVDYQLTMSEQFAKSFLSAYQQYELLVNSSRSRILQGQCDLSNDSCLVENNEAQLNGMMVMTIKAVLIALILIAIVGLLCVIVRRRCQQTEATRAEINVTGELNLLELDDMDLPKL